MLNIIIQTIVKNEDHIINEWIIHNILLGIEHIYIYDDLSEYPILERIKELPEFINNKVTVFRIDIDFWEEEFINSKYYDEDLYIKKKGFKQHYFISYFIKKYSEISKWCFFCDVDEFIYIHNDQLLIDVIEEYDLYDGIYLLWVMYGSSYHIEQPNGLVLDNFKYNSSSYHSWGKTISKISTLKDKIIHCPHFLDYNENIYKFDYTKKIYSHNIHINHFRINSVKTYITKSIYRKEVGHYNGKHREIISLFCGLLSDNNIYNYNNEKYVKKILEIININKNTEEINTFDKIKFNDKIIYFNNYNIIVKHYNEIIELKIDLLDELFNSKNIEYFYYENLPYDFDPSIYIELNNDLKDINLIESKIHYENIGFIENRKYKYDNIPYNFDPSIYIELNNDLKDMSLIESKIHYENAGYKENRKYKYDNIPNDFDPSIYIELNNDLKDMSLIESKIHYENFGFIENRKYKYYIIKKEFNYINNITVLENCYIKITNNNLLNYIIFDDLYIYINGNNDYFNRHILNECENIVNNESEDIANKNIQYYNETYICLLCEESSIPSHFYEQFVCMFNKLFIKNNSNIIIYDTDNYFYNNLINFIKNNIFDITDKNIFKIKNNILYKIKKLFIYPINENNRINYTNYLDLFIINEKNEKKKKYYNIKFNIDAYVCTQDRGFNYSEELINILNKNNYIKLDTSSEYNKQIQLQNSEKIILTWGGNHIINLVLSLYNKNKEALILCNIKYKHEYINTEFYKYRDNNNYYIGIMDFNYIMFVYDICDEIINLQNIITTFEHMKINKIDYRKYNNIPNDLDLSIYIELNNDLKDMNLIAVKNHYEDAGYKENRKYKYNNIPNDFYPSIYIELNNDLKDMNLIESKIHYENIGFIENRKYKYNNIPNDFDPSIYIELNNDLKDINLIESKIHYENFGFIEKRKYKYENILDDFDPSIYIELNNDLKNMSLIESKIHYENFGFIENRKYKYDNIPNNSSLSEFDPFSLLY